MKWILVASMMVWGVGVVSADHWGYPAETKNGELEGPENWGGECAIGRRQSPVDLAEDASIIGRYPMLQFTNYTEVLKNANVRNTGHSVQIDIDPAQKLILSGGGLPGSFIMDQMHFHWASEHTINNDRFGLELHIVSHEERFKTFADAAKVKNGVAVLGVLFHVSDTHNSILKNILDSGEPIKDEPGEKSLLKEPLTVESLLPKNRASFFRYEGSLTTPTCDEAVMWTVFTESIPFEMSQIARFKELKDDLGTPLTHNYRPLKALNSRALVYVKGPLYSGSSVVTCSLVLVAVSQLIRLWF